MEFNKTKPCRECPFLAQMAGWIGGHSTAKDFHELVQLDIRMPCHMTTEDFLEKPVKEQHCAGYAMYMNKMCKSSRDPDTRELQNKVRGKEAENLLFSFDGSKLLEFHGK
jgi:hypothetical protein